MSNNPRRMTLSFTAAAIDAIQKLQKKIDEYQLRQNGTVQTKKTRRKMNKKK